MRSVRDVGSRRTLITRIERLTPESHPSWGNLSVSRMLAHVSDQLRMTVGDIEIRQARGAFRFAPTRYLLVHLLPWPKGRAEAPAEAFTNDPTTLDADRATLLGLIERFAETPPGKLAPLHPLFGRMSARDWDVLSYRHLDHHLRQFGV